MNFVWFFLYFVLSTILFKALSFVGWELVDSILDIIERINGRGHKKLIT